MSKEPNNIDRIVREKLSGFEMAPPPSAWSATEAAIVKPGGKRFFLWLFLGIAVLAFVAVGAYFFTQDEARKALLAKGETAQGITKTTTGKSSVNKEEDDVGLKDLERLNDEELGGKGLYDEELGGRGLKDLKGLNGEELDGRGLNEGSENLGGAKNFGSSDGKSASEAKSSGRLTDKTLSGNAQSMGESLSSRDGIGSAQNDGANGLNNESNAAKSNAKSGDAAGTKKNLNNTASTDAELEIKNDSGRGASGSMNDENAKNGDQQVGRTNNFLKYLFDSLAPRPIQFFETVNPERVASDLEDMPTPRNKPFWKPFSIEGAIGISTFNNKAAEDTEPELLTLLNNAARNRRSYDFRLGLNYYFTKQLSFQAGIEFNAAREDYYFETETTTSSTSYDSVGVYFDSTFMVYIPIFDTVTTVTTSTQTNKKQNYYRLLTLPFQFAWNQPLSIRSELEFAVGGTISIYGRNNGSTIFSSDTIIPSSDAYHTNAMLSLGGSMKYLYNIGSRQAIYVEPWVQFGITNQFAPELTYQSFRNSYGIRLGYRFYF